MTNKLFQSKQKQKNDGGNRGSGHGGNRGTPFLDASKGANEGDTDDQALSLELRQDADEIVRKNKFKEIAKELGGVGVFKKLVLNSIKTGTTLLDPDRGMIPFDESDLTYAGSDVSGFSISQIAKMLLESTAVQLQDTGLTAEQERVIKEQKKILQQFYVE